MPPDFVFALPPAGIFATVFAAVGLIALLLQRLFWLPGMKRYVAGLEHLSTAVATVAGALFGLSVAFLASSVWNTEDKARETVNAEARAIRVIDIYIDSMTGPAHDGFDRLLEDYGRAVAGEWAGMAQGADSKAEQALRTLYDAVIAGLSQGDQNRLLQQRLLVSLDAMSAARQQRLSMAQEVVSAGQWFLVSGLGIVLLAVVAALHARFPFARGVALGFVTLAVSIMLYVIVVHDRPFIGYHALTPMPILKATGTD